MADINFWPTYFWSFLGAQIKQYLVSYLYSFLIATIANVVVRVIQGDRINRRFYMHLCILKNWLTGLQGMASQESIEQASRPKTQAGVNAAGIRQNFSSGKPQFLLCRPPTNCRKLPHITEANLLYIKDYKLIVDININKIPLQNTQIRV